MNNSWLSNWNESNFSKFSLSTLEWNFLKSNYLQIDLSSQIVFMKDSNEYLLTLPYHVLWNSRSHEIYLDKNYSQFNRLTKEIHYIGETLQTLNFLLHPYVNKYNIFNPFYIPGWKVQRLGKQKPRPSRRWRPSMYT